jgi:hypothetical protein
MLYTFRETKRFTRRVLELMTDDDYGRLQNYLTARPDAGDVIQGSGGIRKIRWAAGGKGKRGGVRVLYYFFAAGSEFYMLGLYPKSERADLTPDELKELKALVEEWLP